MTSLRFEPLATVGPTEHRQAAPSAERIDCPTCGKTFVGGVIVTEWPGRYLAEHGAWGVVRKLYCDHCDHVLCWMEALQGGTVHTDVNAAGDILAIDGRLSGQWLMRIARVRTPAVVARFLTQHPEAAGVSQC